MIRAARLVVIAAVAIVFLPLAVQGGIADSPLPVLMAGKTTLHLYSVPGIRNFVDLGSFFSCTSMDTAPMQVGVEVFASGGTPVNDAVATSLSVPAGATVTFGTFTAAGISIDADLGAPFFFAGSARILATSKKLACTAFIAEAGNAPPTVAWQLTIIAKTKQKAAN